MEEGYIKFKADWEQGETVPPAFLRDVNKVRTALFEKGWIGQDPNGIGFGNISKRWSKEGEFVISGTATGYLRELQPTHFSLVKKVNFSENSLRCVGPVLASSESMSHAAIYQQCPDVHGVIHIHDKALWEKWKDRAPTTPASATYGTPEMAEAIRSLLAEPATKNWQFLVMGGHEDGCMAFGKDLQEAFQVLEKVQQMK